MRHGEAWSAGRERIGDEEEEEDGRAEVEAAGVAGAVAVASGIGPESEE